MKHLILAAVLLCSSAYAEQKIAANFVNEEITKIIEAYSKATGQKFVVDSVVRGKASLLNNEEVTAPEFFNQLSVALALNGFAIVTLDNTMVVRPARSVQRDYLEVSEKVPSVQPQRMYTWVYTPKYVAAMDVQKDLRLLTSSYGEMASMPSTNQLVVTDWTPNIVRISEMLKAIDRPVSASSKKLAAQAMANDRVRAKALPPQPPAKPVVPHSEHPKKEKQ